MLGPILSLHVEHKYPSTLRMMLLLLLDSLELRMLLMDVTEPGRLLSRVMFSIFEGNEGPRGKAEVKLQTRRNANNDNSNSK